MTGNGVSMRAMLLLIGAAAIGCSEGAEAKRDVLMSRPASTISVLARAQLDSGNAAFRARDLAKARTHYEKVVKAEPSLAAPWMGLAMVARASADSALLRRALREVDRLSPGSSASHPVGGSLPPNHPDINPHSQKASTTRQ